MAWVRIVPEERAEGELAAAYARVRRQRGKVAGVIAVSGALPTVMERGVDYYLALMYGSHSLPRADRERVAVEVSRANACAYCVQHHAAALARVLHDDAAAERAAHGDTAGLAAREVAMLGYARKLTLAPATVGPQDVEALRKAGLDDEQVVAVNHVVAYFNMMNRIVLGLGVELEQDAGADPAYKY
ncbi:MAG: peroxidase-related enzyme [Halobacteriales archaeon]|nr:peroxidase-related enzyme [Halobacteriales archaeon]